MTTAPDWVGRFYDRKSLAAGPSGVLDHHRERAASISRFGGVARGRVLELGAGAGGSAVASAELGYDVVAVELSAVRAGFARELVTETGVGVSVVEDDFMAAEIRGRFDAVTCWNGFGVGSDDDQRALLRRVARDWLARGAVMVLDVFNPVGWSRLAGASERDEETGLHQEIDFDPVGCRFLDSWWFDGDDSPPLTQSVRCYSPADLALLVEGTGLAVDGLEVGGEPLDRAARGVSGPLGETWGYRARLSALIGAANGTAGTVDA